MTRVLAWDESLIVIGLTDHVHLETQVSAYVHVFQSVLTICFVSNGSMYRGQKLFGSLLKCLTFGSRITIVF